VNQNRRTAGELHPPTSITPRLLVKLALEECPRIRLVCASLEDEERLVSWLEVSSELHDLGARILQTIVEAA
jgi:hypothetical protein